jgi:hypothetical protein
MEVTPMKSFYKMALALAAAAMVFSCGKPEKVITNTVDGDVVVAAVSFLAGNVSRDRGGVVEALNVGDLLKPADILITGDNAEADVSLKGYGVMKIGSLTKVRVLELQKGDTGSNARIGLEKGKIVSLINRKDATQNYEIVTPTAVAGVRGTVFLTSVTGEETKPEVKVAVLSGAVAVQSDGSEVILSEGTQMVVNENRRISREMVRPLGEDSLKEIRRLSVFHRTNVFEYNSMMEEIRQTTPELKKLEGADSAESSMERHEAREARMESDNVERAQRVDLSRHIKRDTEGDPIKLEPGSGFE